MPSPLRLASLVVPLGAAFWLAGGHATAAAADLSLKRVMLSSAGVGYFEYAADVDGPAMLGLDIPLDQVDDVLKSLVVFDEAGGVGGVELPGRDASHAAFGAVPFGPEALASPVDLLNALQGVEIAVQGPRPGSGRIIRAERVREPGPAGTAGEARGVDRTRVTLLGAEGLRQFVLEEADSVQVADPALRERIGRALEAVRRDSGQDARHLVIRAAGDGHRTVRVGYVAVAPLWKASYRLVLPSPDASLNGTPGSTARVQGWAVLENVSGADWNGVELALQYGNPVTFHQAIYRSYFVPRPEVPVEILGRLLPDVDTRARGAGGLGSAASLPPPAPSPGSSARALARPAPPVMAMPKLAEPEQAAAVSEGMEETVFVLPTPVTLAAGHTSSVPILDRAMPAERMALAQADRPHPLATVKLANDAGLSLPAGVLTLYDQSGPAPFAGDARLGGLPAGETRLLAFAEDLRTTTDWSHRDDTSVASLTAAAGVLRVQQRERHTDTIAITAPATEQRRVLLEIPKRPDTTLVRDGLDLPVEETATAWRVTAAVGAGQTRTVVLRTDHLVRQEVALLDETSVVVQLIGEQGLTERVRAALRHVTELQQAESTQTAAREKLQAEMDGGGARRGAAAQQSRGGGGGRRAARPPGAPARRRRATDRPAGPVDHAGRRGGAAGAPGAGGCGGGVELLNGVAGDLVALRLAPYVPRCRRLPAVNRTLASNPLNGLGSVATAALVLTKRS